MSGISGAPSFADVGVPSERSLLGGVTREGWDAKRSGSPTAPVDQKVYAQQVRDHLKFLDYAPLVFVSAATGLGIQELFRKVELVARERRKRVTTGQMNRFLANQIRAAFGFIGAPIRLKLRPRNKKSPEE